jgi:hypothetical protein
MDSEKPIDTVDAEALLWLAEAHRKNDFVSSRPPQGVKQLLGSPLWAEELFREEIELPYEPRCLAVSRNGKLVAAGTKAGTVHVARWKEPGETERGRWERFVYPQVRPDSEPAPDEEREAIRAIGVVGDAKVIAGTGDGKFLVVDLARGLKLASTVRSRSKGKARESAWSLRFTRIIPAAPPGLPPKDGPWMLGLTQGESIHLLLRERGRFRAITAPFKDLLPSWPRRDLRLVDGVWERGRLWLLDAEGRIYRLRAHPGGNATAPLADLEPDDGAEPWIRPVAYPYPSFEPRRLLACGAGLGLLVSHHVTFLPFPVKREPPSREPPPPGWTSIDQITDIAIWQPFANLEDQGTEAPDNIVWIVAGSAQPGLSWTRWPTEQESEARADGVQGEPANDETAARAADAGSMRSHSEPSTAPPNEAGVGPRSVLLAAFCRFEEGPNYLVVATRDHRLLITSLLHKPQTRRVLVERMRQLLGSRPSDAAARWSALDPGHRTPGVALWLLRACVYRDRRVPPPRALDSSPMLAMLSVADLRRLGKILLRNWRDPAAFDERAFDERAQVIQRWTLHLLQRAFQLDPAEPRRLARQIYDGIAHNLAASADADREAAAGSEDPLPKSVWHSLRPFAGFLRKWIVNGRSYAVKETGLVDLVRWNLACSYHLDAMVYLAKLSRKRFDAEWLARGAPAPGLPIWDLVAERSGRFSIQSFTDGSLTALSRGGRKVRWTASDQIAGSLTGKQLQLSADGLVLNHRRHKEFFDRYRHGPYVRRLTLREVGPDRFLLLGCFRGWRPQHQQSLQERPLLVAMLLCPRATENDPREVEVLEISGIESVGVCEELYGIHFLGSSKRSSVTTFRYLAGTRGLWDAGGEHTGRIPMPFIEIRIRLQSREQAPNIASIETVRPECLEARSAAGQLPGDKPRDELWTETSRNPCWCLTTVEVGKKLWLWAGFADGRLRCFQRRWRRGNERWIEGGGGGLDENLVEDAERPRDRSIPCTAAIWQLCYVEELDLLAYGTADGVVGAVSMAALRRADASRPWLHLLHSREMAPISGLLVVRDEGVPQLLSLSQDGYATLYHLRDPVTTNPGRFAFPGFWLDRFPFRHAVQAVAQVTEDPSTAGEAPAGDQQAEGSPPSDLAASVRWARIVTPSRMPTLLVGSADGGVNKHRLVLPRGSERRRKAVELFSELMDNEQRTSRRGRGTDTTPTLAYCVGGDPQTIYDWLQVLDTGGLEMMRLSFWLQLDELAKALRTDPLNPEKLDASRRLVDRLAPEAFSRRPLGRDPAKILWEEAAKAANRIAREALPPADQQRADRLLEVYNAINRRVDDLCNRWIGSQQAIEARVLIHSFNVFFDWPDVLLIAWLDPPPNAVKSQRFLLLNAIHRRLGYGEYMVRLETLRVLNRALRWAIVNLRRDGLEKRMRIGLLPLHRSPQAGPEQEDQPVGFYELLARVGHLAASHHDSLSHADPLTSEIARFFALSILLVPDCALIIGRTMSECRILDRGPELSASIAQEARDLARQLGLRRSKRVADGLNRFHAYCSPRLDLRLADWGDSDWWRQMTEGARPVRRAPDSPEKITDADLLFEQRRALHAASYLASLEKESGSKPGPGEAEGRDWLEENNNDQVYLGHSHRYLRHLQGTRVKIQAALDEDLTAPLHPTDTEALTQQASKLCDETLAKLDKADLFEPQRTHYRQVILAWRDHIERRARRAVAILDAIDRFNRHTYRTSADHFMSSVLELVMQTAPLPFRSARSDRSKPGQSLRQRVDDVLANGHPLLREIFIHGTELVEHTHLAGTLLALARDMLQQRRGSESSPGSAPPGERSYEVTLQEIKTEIENATERFNLSLGPVAFPENEEALGTRAIWRTVIHEWVRNVRRHGLDTSREPHLRVALPVRADGRRGAMHRVLLLSGNRSFAAGRPSGDSGGTLTPAFQAQLEEEIAKDGEEAERWLAQKIWQPRGSRISPTSESGMGMFFIRMICGLVGLETNVRLCDVAAGLSDRNSLTLDDLRSPLCLEISWPAARESEPGP